MPKYLLKKTLKKALRVITKAFSHRARFGREHRDITIISNNCIAGFLYNDFHIPYNSPTVGLQFTQKGFVRFCRDFESYIALPLTAHPNPSEIEFHNLGGDKINFPVGKLGDLTLFLQHYKNVDEAAAAWAKRAQRISRSKVFFIFMAYDNTDASVIKEFQSLPLRNSLTLTLMERPDSPSSFPLLCGKEPWYSKDPNTRNPYYWRFDYIDWLKNCL